MIEVLVIFPWKRRGDGKEIFTRDQILGFRFHGSLRHFASRSIGRRTQQLCIYTHTLKTGYQKMGTHEQKWFYRETIDLKALWKRILRPDWFRPVKYPVRREKKYNGDKGKKKVYTLLCVCIYEWDRRNWKTRQFGHIFHGDGFSCLFADRHTKKS